MLENENFSFLKNFSTKLVSHQDFCINLVKSLVKNLNWSEEFKFSLNKDENFRSQVYNNI